MNKFHNLDLYNTVSSSLMINKIGEELAEVVNAIINKDKENIKEELCVLIQCCYGLAYTMDIKIEDCIEKHNEKLLSRGHKFI